MRIPDVRRRFDTARPELEAQGLRNLRFTARQRSLKAEIDFMKISRPALATRTPRANLHARSEPYCNPESRAQGIHDFAVGKSRRQELKKLKVRVSRGTG